MKKVLLSILLTLLPLLASAETIEVNGVWYNIITKGNKAEVTSNPSGENYSGVITILEKVTYNNVEYTVTKIGDYALSGVSDMATVTIPNTVESIGNSAFYGSHITSIIIPNSVTSIGSWAFSMCHNLTSITIPQSMSFIGSFAFDDCRNLTSITIPNKITTIESCTFRNCHLLNDIIFPINLSEIYSSAFENCLALTTVTLPNNVKSLYSNVFKGCSSLKSVTIPPSIISIGSEVFANCEKMTDVYCLSEQIRDDTNSYGSFGLYTNPNAFLDSYPEYITLHVPAASIEAYRSTEPWSQFKATVSLEDDDNPEIQKCATPEISYTNGKLTFTCETEGAEFVASITDTDIKTHYGTEITLSLKYTVSVYATKTGYENSDVATREIVIENSQTSLFGDLNKDGKVNVADHVKLSDIIMNK